MANLPINTNFLTVVIIDLFASISYINYYNEVMNQMSFKSEQIIKDVTYVFASHSHANASKKNDKQSVTRQKRYLY